MSKRSHFQGRQKVFRQNPSTQVISAKPVAAERKPPVTYGKPFILLEDPQKVAFIFRNGQWVQFERTIAECRLDCQVKELPQKINGKTRFQICEPIIPNA